MSEPRPPWSPPEEFEEYRLLRPLGRGAMGQVFLAQDTLLDRPVAVKFIAAEEPSADARERFFVEARAVARLQHPNVVAIYRVGEVQRRPYLVSEFLRGQSLDRLEKPLGAEELLELAIQLSRGLAAAHRRGVLHRDIKPANAMRTEDGTVKLLDFGLAKLLDAQPVPGVGTISPAPVASPAPDLPPAPVSDTAPPGGADTWKRGAEEPNDDASRELSPSDTLIRERGPAPAAATLDLPSLGDSPPADATLDLPPGGPTSLGPPRQRSGAESPRVSTGSMSPSLTQAGAVMGSPLYMAPEAWLGEVATPRTDVYSLGVLLFELASARTPHHGCPLSRLPALTMEKDAPPLRAVAPGIPVELAEVVDRCLGRAPEARYESADALREALERLKEAGRGQGALPQGNPYRGLMSFEAEHRRLFFGRAAETRAVLDRLRAEPFLVLSGDSGVGKSSLCRAGVIPAIEDGELGGGGWRMVRLVPGRHPLVALAAALAPILETAEETLCERLRAEPGQLGRELRQRLGTGGVLLFVDQLEELVTLAAPEEAALAAEALASLTLRTQSLRLLATARSDFLGRLAALPSLGDDLARALYLLRPPTPEGVREAIVGPARALGCAFENQQMVEALTAGATGTEGSLPLLQFALAELWNARDEGQRRIPAEALERMGGVEGALARHADGVIATLLAEPRAAARRILLQLVTGELTRTRRRESELLTGHPAAPRALEALVHGRLLVAREAEDGEGSYEVAHEALITGWSTLREWLSSDAGTRALRNRLESAAAEWERLGGARETLWSGRQLAECALLDPEELTPKERGFLAASRRWVRNKRLGRIAAVLAVPAILLATFGGVRLAATLQRDRLVERRLENARGLAAAAAEKNAEVERLRLEAFRLFAANQNEAGEAGWAEARTGAATLEGLHLQVNRVLESARTLDANNERVREGLADLAVERLLSATREGRTERVVELADQLRNLDRSGLRLERIRRPAQVSLDSQPSGARVELAYYEEVEGKLRLGPATSVGQTPLDGLLLEPRSAVLVLRAPGRAPVTQPLLAGPGEQLALSLVLPAEDSIPEGFVYVPPGRFLYGSGDDEDLRRSFFNAVPLHPRETGPFLVGRHEVTFAEWIAFLRELPAAARQESVPALPGSGRSGMRLTEQGGLWRLEFAPGSVFFRVLEGEPLRYPGRKRRSVQDWTRFPVTAISPENAQAYTRWLAASGRVPGARLCTELEWERAARGADARPFPCGTALRPEDANFDETYGRSPGAIGPDEVGSYAHCASPFGLLDLAGNAWEFALSETGTPVVRGGGYYYRNINARIPNREPVEPTFRDVFAGFRVCADLP